MGNLEGNGWLQEKLLQNKGYPMDPL